MQTGKGPEIAIMHVDSVATNAARRVIQPLDDVAKALQLTESDFAPVPWKAGLYNGARYAIPLDVHPLGFFYNKTVMEKGGLDPEKPPTTNDEYMTALDTLKSKGIEGHWLTPFPFTGSHDRAVPALAVRRRPVQPGRLGRHLGRRTRRQGDDLVRRPGQERLLARPRSARTATLWPCRAARRPSTGTASGTPSR